MITKEKVTVCKCERCGYKWQPKDSEPPEVCARCKSRFWNVPKVKK